MNDQSIYTVRAVSVNQVLDLRNIATTTFVKSFGEYNTKENLDVYLERSFGLTKLTEELNHPEIEYYFVKSEPEIAGYLKLKRGESQSEHFLSNAIEIERLYILPRYFGKGVGHALMQFAIQRGVDHCKDWIWLGVWEHNPRATQFYKKWAFTRFGEHPFMMGSDRQIDILMKRRLKSE